MIHHTPHCWCKERARTLTVAASSPSHSSPSPPSCPPLAACPSWHPPSRTDASTLAVVADRGRTAGSPSFAKGAALPDAIASPFAAACAAACAVAFAPLLKVAGRLEEVAATSLQPRLQLHHHHHHHHQRRRRRHHLRVGGGRGCRTRRGAPPSTDYPRRVPVPHDACACP